MPRFLVALLCLGLFLSSAGSTDAQIHSLETEDLRLLHIDVLQSYIAPYAAQCFENAMEFYRSTLGLELSEKVTVLFTDAGDYNNASALAAPRNTILLGIAPTNTTYETSPSNERINHTLNHELAHIAALDQASGGDGLFRSLFFGKVRATPENPETILYDYLTQPRRAAPRWYHEGFAVFLETWMAGGQGRAQGAYDEMVFRSMVRDSSYFYDPVGLESEGTKVDFQIGVNAYLYGTRFLSYVALQYSPQQLIDWVSRKTEGSKRYYTSQFKNVFGLSMDNAWQDWIRWEHAFQQTNLDSIRQYPVTPYSDISRKALGSVSRAFYDPQRQELFAAVNYPGEIGHLAAIHIPTGSMRKICEIKGPALYFVTSLAYDPDTGTLFYSEHNGDWRDLYSVNVDTGKRTVLQRKARVGDFTFNRTDRSLWGVRHYNGISTLVRIPHPYDKWNQVWSPPYGQVIYDIDISPDGEDLSLSLGEISGRQTLRLAKTADLLSGSTETRTIYDFGASLPGNFVFDKDGDRLFGSSYYTGVSNIWRYDIPADSMDIVSNGETGFFRPTPLSPDSLIVFRYTGDGFVPATIHAQPLFDVSPIIFLGNEIAEKHPQVLDWNVGSPAEIPIDSLTTNLGPYRGSTHIDLISAYPIAQGYKEHGSAGVRLDFSDPGYAHQLNLSLSYTPNTRLPEKERLHAKFVYERGPWSLTARHNAADFYDLFGPTKTSRKASSLGISRSINLFSDSPKSLDLSVNTAGYINMERLPYAQNVTAEFDKLWNTSLRLSFRNQRASLGAADYERGWRWGLNVVNNYADKRAFPLLWGEVDFGLPFLFKHSSLWLRNSSGFSPGANPDDGVSFEHFFFGGFGNNYVDRGRIKRFREFDSFPGVEINELAGTSFARTLLEWNLPPLRFKRVGTSWYYLTWLRPTLFAAGLSTNLDREDYRINAGSVGGQIDLRFTLLSRLNMTLSAGYAVAAIEKQRHTDEFMLSLKIL